MVEARRATRAQTLAAVLRFPAEVDIACSRRLCGELGSALASATTVIADMTATTFCDSSGVRLLVMAHEQATATGVDLRLVVPSADVLRTLALLGVDWLLPVYPSLEDALGPEPRAGTVSYLPSRMDGPSHG